MDRMLERLKLRMRGGGAVTPGLTVFSMKCRRGAGIMTASLLAGAFLAWTPPTSAQPATPVLAAPLPATPPPVPPPAGSPALPSSAEDTRESAPSAESQVAPFADAPPVVAPSLALDGQPERDAEVIVVTAQFREQDPQQMPLSLTAVGGLMLEERGQTNIVEIANQVPNMRLSPGAGPLGPALQAHIRGVGQHDFHYAFEPGVGIYVDDVYFATLTGSLIDLLDLDRVEILRGPQGTLAGQNSIGGAVKLYSTAPQEGNGGFVQVTYGAFHRTEARAAGDFSLVDHRLLGRIAGVAKQQDGYVTRYDYACTHPDLAVPSFQNTDSCELGREGGKSYAAVRTALRWLPAEWAEVNVSGDYTGDNSPASPTTLLYVGTSDGPGVPNAPMSGTPAANTLVGDLPLGTAMGSQFISQSPFGGYALDPFSRSPYINYSTYQDPAPLDGSAPYGVPPVYRVSGGGASARIALDVTEAVALTSITAERYYAGEWSVDEGTPANTYLLHNQVWHRQFTQEVRANIRPWGDRFHLTLGGFYLHQRNHNGNRVSLRTTRFVADDSVSASSLAGFGNGEWQVMPALTLIAGARITRQKKTYSYGRLQIPGASAPLSPTLAELDGTVGEFVGHRFDYRAAVQYQWLPELMTYAQVATGFKGGGVNPRPFFADQALSHDPETLTAYELGAKADWFRRRLRVNVAAFSNRYRDIVMMALMCPAGSTPTPCSLPINAGTAHVVGGELEARLLPLAGLGIDGSLSYLNFRYTSISAAGASSGITLDMKGPFAPTWNASLGARYDITLGTTGLITARLDLSYRGAFYTNANNTPFGEVDGRTLLNGRLMWKSADELWQATLEVTNITNLLYYNYIRDDRSSSYTVQGQPAPPRQWALTLRRNML